MNPKTENLAAVHRAALQAHAAGLCVIPPAEDGTKRPLPNSRGTWEAYKTRRQTNDEMCEWYPGRSGLGIISGPVSGHIECWDFDERGTYQDFRARASECGLGGVVDRIEAGYLDETPAGGFRWLVGYPAEVKREPNNIKLARRPKRPEERQHENDKIKTLIELPPFAIVAPSNGAVHPSGKPYARRSGSFSTIASYTPDERDALIELARSFDAMPRASERTGARGHAGEDRPGDDYASRTTWRELLEPEGWKLIFERGGVTYWRRPGKAIGISATTNFGGADLFYVFTSSTPFEPDTAFSRFGAYAYLKHGGDFQAAARALAAQGYGAHKGSAKSDGRAHGGGTHGASGASPNPLDGLIERATADPGAPFVPEVLKALVTLRKSDPAAFEKLRAQLKKAGVRVGELDKALARESGEHTSREPTQADVLIEVSSDAELFHAPDGTGYADIEISGHRETFPIRSKAFKQWLARRYFEEERGAPSSEALQSTLNVIDARARFDGPERKAHVRVAELNGKIYLDLADNAWRAVEIDADGWRVVPAPPVRFRRPAGMMPLPEPALGGSVTALRAFLNVKSDGDFVLAVAWLLATLRSGEPYPVLALYGEQGSAKSTFSRILRALIDPNTASLRSLPRKEDDLVIAAHNGHILAFDNVSVLKPDMADALCRLATGGGFGTRQLYTDTDETLLDATRPVILNGIEDIIARPDLADRAIALTLTPIPEEERQLERELWAQFEREQPGILGALLDAVAHGLRMLPETVLERLPRMADFARWSTACEGALWAAGTFEDAYAVNCAKAAETALEADPFASAVRTLVTGDPPEWAGTATGLLTALNGTVGETVSKSRDWPKVPNVLPGRLRRAAPLLRKAGIDIRFDERTSHKRTNRIHIQRRVRDEG